MTAQKPRKTELKEKLVRAEIARSAYHSRMEELQGEIQKFCLCPILVYETTDGLAVAKDEHEDGIPIDWVLKIIHREGELTDLDFKQHAIL